MSKPIAVLISDVHYSLNTLELADKAMRHAIDMSNQLQVPLVVAGDLHHTKANLRSECVKAMIDTFLKAWIPPILLVGNHDRINERNEAHALEFLRPYASIVDSPMRNLIPGWTLIPYNHDVAVLRAYLAKLPDASSIIMHQGLEGSHSGEYIQDKSALNPSDVSNFRVISGHYHKRQDIKTGRPREGAVGLFSYIGNPYTLTFGEAADPDKGFQLLNEDGTTEFVPTYLRKHHVIQHTPKSLWESSHVTLQTIDDLFWVKISGPKEELAKVSKDRVAWTLGITDSFRLDLIPTDELSRPKEVQLAADKLMDSLIDSLSETSEDRKAYLKTLWKTLCE